MQFSLAALVLAAAAFAHAQSTTDTSAGSIPTDLSGISPCLLTCISQAKGCSSLTDVTCFCTNAEFQAEALACLQKSCTAEDLATVTALQQAECGSICESRRSLLCTPLPPIHHDPHPHGRAAAGAMHHARPYSPRQHDC
ncbi:hypothetical protein C8Q80DRAFT_1109672 [Daedaleopsis nitida]|nr:hypothetical protein C8Q80DRAFT_1109672 [Daedaleopsis nitida]